jgi:PST family polysaccharide transporter
MFVRDKVLRLRKSKDGKILIENFLSLSFLQVAGYIFPLLTLPYLARVIGVDKFGEIAFASSIIVYFQTVVDWGFNYTATRDVVKNKDDINKVSEIFCGVMGAKLLLLLANTVIFTICVYLIPSLFERRLLLWMTYLYIPGHILFPEWFFQAMEKMKYITIINVISKLIFTILVFIVITKKEDYIFQPILLALGYFVCGFISLWIILKKFNVVIILPLFLNIYCILKRNFEMFLNTLLPNLYTNFSIILLGVFGGNTATGLFSSGKKFIDLGEVLLQMLSRTFFPYLARRIDKHSFYVKVCKTSSISTAIVLFIFADIIVKLFYTDAFSNASIVIRIMAVCPFFQFLLDAYGTNYLILKQQEKIVRKVLVFCSVLGFVLSLIIVPRFNYIGVAAVFAFLKIIRGVLTWYCAKKY